MMMSNFIIQPVEQRWEEKEGRYVHKKFKKCASSSSSPPPPPSSSYDHQQLHHSFHPFKFHPSLPVSQNATSFETTSQNQKSKTQQVVLKHSALSLISVVSAPHTLNPSSSTTHLVQDEINSHHTHSSTNPHTDGVGVEVCDGSRNILWNHPYSSSGSDQPTDLSVNKRKREEEEEEEEEEKIVVVDEGEESLPPLNCSGEASLSIPNSSNGKGTTSPPQDQTLDEKYASLQNETSESFDYIRGRGRGKYVCSVCGMKCKKPSMLKKHIRSHTNFRPYACTTCTFAFKTKGNLTKHLKSKSHHQRECKELGINVLQDDEKFDEDGGDSECDDSTSEESISDASSDVVLSPDNNNPQGEISTDQMLGYHDSLRRDEPEKSDNESDKTIDILNTSNDEHKILISSQAINKSCGEEIQNVKSKTTLLIDSGKCDEATCVPANITMNVKDLNNPFKIENLKSTKANDDGRSTTTNSVVTVVCSGVGGMVQHNSTPSDSLLWRGVEKMKSPPTNEGGGRTVSKIGTSNKVKLDRNQEIIQTTSDGRSICGICEKVFAKASQLRLHVNIHYMERPFKCEDCAISFRSKGHLVKHERSAGHFNKVNINQTFGAPSSSNPRPFKCCDCIVKFRIHGHLAKHLRSKMHIIKLESLGKLPCGMYLDIERNGNTNINDIGTADCFDALLCLQQMALEMYSSDVSKCDEIRKSMEEVRYERDLNESSNPPMFTSNNSMISMKSGEGRIEMEDDNEIDAKEVSIRKSPTPPTTSTTNVNNINVKLNGSLTFLMAPQPPSSPNVSNKMVACIAPLKSQIHRQSQPAILTSSIITSSSGGLVKTLSPAIMSTTSANFPNNNIDIKSLGQSSVLTPSNNDHLQHFSVSSSNIHHPASISVSNASHFSTSVLPSPVGGGLASMFKCNLCATVLPSIPSYQQHMRLSHGMFCRPHVCNECDAGFQTPYQLSSHIVSVHRLN